MPDILQRYFDTLNAKDFQQTVLLFAPQGQLVPPFEEPVVGREAIAHYLATEASEMEMTPLTCTAIQEESLEEKTPKEKTVAHTKTFQVKGKVKHLLFVVNVAWQFEIDGTDHISSVNIKLLASLKELIKINRQ